MTRITSIVLMALINLAALSSPAMAQSENAAKADSTHVEKHFKVKKISISGTVGASGLTLINDGDNRMWNVANPESLKASEGQRVTVKALLVRNTSQINVSSVRLSNEKPSARMGDSAFRR
jgi:hypothetical protein